MGMLLLSLSKYLICLFIKPLLLHVEHQTVLYIQCIFAAHLHLSSLSWSRYSITSSKVVRLTVKHSKSCVTLQWLSVGSLLLWLVAVSVGLSVEPGEATVWALLNTAAIMENVKGVIFWGVTVGVPWVAQLTDFCGISQPWREIQFCKAIPARCSHQPAPLSLFASTLTSRADQPAALYISP